MWPLSTKKQRDGDHPDTMGTPVDVRPKIFLVLICGTEEGCLSSTQLKIRFDLFLWSGSLSVALKL